MEKRVRSNSGHKSDDERGMTRGRKVGREEGNGGWHSF